MRTIKDKVLCIIDRVPLPGYEKDYKERVELINVPAQGKIRQYYLLRFSHTYASGKSGALNDCWTSEDQALWPHEALGLAAAIVEDAKQYLQAGKVTVKLSTKGK